MSWGRGRRPIRRREREDVYCSCKVVVLSKRGEGEMSRAKVARRLAVSTWRREGEGEIHSPSCIQIRLVGEKSVRRWETNSFIQDASRCSRRK